MRYDELPDDMNKLSKEILDVCFYVHTQLGPGLLESVYEDSIYYFLTKKGLKAERQKKVALTIDEFHIPTRLTLDLIVENKIIVELKTVEKIIPIHEAQLHTYLKLSNIQLGLLINFNVQSLKHGIKRIIRTG